MAATAAVLTLPARGGDPGRGPVENRLAEKTTLEEWYRCGARDLQPDRVRRVVGDELAEVATEHGTPRRTVLLEAAEQPVAAAGGVGTAEDVRALLTAGADAVSAGTAFLLTPEAGTSAAHRAAVAACAAGTRFSADDGRARTALTRAYTGRWARSLATAFMAEHPDAPAAYPEVNVLTTGLRAAAAAAGDLERVHLWAGTEAHRVREAPAADVLASLTP